MQCHVSTQPPPQAETHELNGLMFVKRGVVVEVDHVWRPLTVPLANGDTTIGILPEGYRPISADGHYAWVYRTIREVFNGSITIKNTGEVMITNNGSPVNAGTKFSIETITYLTGD